MGLTSVQACIGMGYPLGCNPIHTELGVSTVDDLLHQVLETVAFYMRGHTDMDKQTHMGTHTLWTWKQGHMDAHTHNLPMADTHPQGPKIHP